MRDKHYLGEFSDIDEVYVLYPSGGVSGDYIILNGSLIIWNDHQRIWGRFRGFEPISGVETQTVEGNLNITHNLRVGGSVMANRGKFDTLEANEVIFPNNPFASSDHNHDESYANKKHKHLLADIKDLLDYVDDAMSESGFSTIKMWQALDNNTEHQINISHLSDLVNTLRGAYLSRQNDDFAEGNITFRKKIEVIERAMFRGGATFISDGLPEEIHDVITEPYGVALDDYLLEEMDDRAVVASGYLERFKN